MEKNNLISKWEKYYSRLNVLIEIAKQLKMRECAFIASNGGIKIRGIMAFSSNFLKMNMNRFGLAYNLCHIYKSLLKFRRMERFSFIIEERKKQTKKWNEMIRKDIKSEKDNIVESYDFVIDIDCIDLKKAWKDAVKVKKYFDKEKIPYYVQFSGKKGFHFVSENLFNGSVKKQIEKSKEFAKELAKKLRLKYIDLGIYDARRIIKVAYSLTNANGKINVVLPLTDEQFGNFNPDLCSMENILKNINITKRGLLKRWENGNRKNLRDYIKT